MVMLMGDLSDCWGGWETSISAILSFLTSASDVKDGDDIYIVGGVRIDDNIRQTRDDNLASAVDLTNSPRQWKSCQAID
jgi:hypothetical protein